MPRIEYRTTLAMAEFSNWYAESPHPPDGEGWSLVGTAATALPSSDFPAGRIALVHTWARVASAEPKEAT